MDEQHAPVGTPEAPARREPDRALPRPRAAVPYETARHGGTGYESGGYETARYEGGGYESGPYALGRYETGPYGTGSHGAASHGAGPYDVGLLPPGRPGLHPSSPPMPAATDAHRSPYPTAPAPSGAPRTVVVLALTVVALAVLALAGVLLYPRLTAATVVAAPSVAPPAPTAVAPVVPAVPRSATGYSCGTAGGYSIWVNNGNVPCSSAQWVTSMWTTTGQTPQGGAGPAGTPYSWTCASSTAAMGLCTSKMGSTVTISS